MKRTAAMLLALALTLTLAACGRGGDATGSSEHRGLGDMLSDLTDGKNDGTAASETAPEDGGSGTTAPDTRPDPDIFRALNYIGDTDEITMTAAQAAELAGVLERRCAYCADRVKWQNSYDDIPDLVLSTFAALFDTGNGVPAMLFVGGGRPPYDYAGKYDMESPYTAEIWLFVDGKLTRMNVDMVSIFEDHILMGGYYPDGTGYYGEARMLENGFIRPAATWGRGEGFLDDSAVYEIDGAATDEAGLENWIDTWDGRGEAGFSHGSDVSAWCWGVDEADTVMRVLRLWAGLDGESSGDGEADFEVQSIYAVDPEGGLGGLLESTYEYPRFDESWPGYAFVNGYFEAEAMNRRDMYGSNIVSGPAESEFFDDTTVSVTYDDGKMLSVAQNYSYFGGGVMDVGMDCAVFDLTRGELLTLDEVVAMDSYDITSAIRDGLIAQGWESEFFDGQLYSMGIGDFDFYISAPDTVTVVFDKYEIADGASGIFSVDLPRAK